MEYVWCLLIYVWIKLSTFMYNVHKFGSSSIWLAPQSAGTAISDFYITLSPRLEWYILLERKWSMGF